MSSAQGFLHDAPDTLSGRRIGIALAGLGRYTDELLEALEHTRLTTLAGLITDDLDKGRRIARDQGLPESRVFGYDQVDELARQPGIDAVYVVLPNSLHASYTIRCLDAGLHVICEKPMALDEYECQRMIEARDRSGKQLGIGYRLHYEPQNLELVRLRDSKKMGRPRRILAKFGMDIDPTDWRLERSLAGGGALMDVGIYCLQAARNVTGQEPIKIRAARKEHLSDPRFRQVEGALAWEMVFPDGARALCFCAYDEEMDLLEVTFERGWGRLEPAFDYEGQKLRLSDGRKFKHRLVQQAIQMDDFSRACLTGRPVKVSAEMGQQDVRLMSAIYRAADHMGRWIEIPPSPPRKEIKATAEPVTL